MADDDKAVRDMAASELADRRLVVELAFDDVERPLRRGSVPDMEDAKTLREELEHAESVIDSYIRARSIEEDK